jgi:hypothetical protein
LPSLQHMPWISPRCVKSVARSHGGGACASAGLTAVLMMERETRVAERIGAIVLYGRGPGAAGKTRSRRRSPRARSRMTVSHLANSSRLLACMCLALLVAGSCSVTSVPPLPTPKLGRCDTRAAIGPRSSS